MARRIDIELTSRADGVWTWRAAGAKQPRGVVESQLVPEGINVGDVVKADVASGLDGWEITGLAPLSAPDPEEARSSDRIEILPRFHRDGGVTVEYAGGSRRRGDRGSERGRRPPLEGARGDSRSGAAGDRNGSRRGPGGPSGPRRPTDGRGRHEETCTKSNDQSGGRGSAPERVRRTDDVRPREPKPAVSTVHRNAFLATLGPEQLAVAEQLIRGGLPAVRRALAEQRAGQPGAPANDGPLLAMAEQLLPGVNLATWKDRAVAARGESTKLRLGDLRSVVAAARAVTLDDEGRELARALRDVLTQRVAALHDEWVAKINGSLDAGAVRDALLVASRPPEPSMRLAAEQAIRLAHDAGAAMTASRPAKEWLDLLKAVVDSPVRRNVKPAGIPDTAAVREAARNASGQVPELAKLLGLRMPPPPPRRALVVRPTPLSRAAG
ncbi:MAG: hypothetical protein M0Z95_14490 [Actinomycetota bacterium]|nr:hypothetical protein [Actinomycetota bacterium]